MTRTHELRRVAESIAGAFLDGEWEPHAMAARAGPAIGDERTDTWLLDLALVLIRAFRERPVDAPGELADVILHTDVLRDRWDDDRAADRPPWTPRPVLVATAMAGRRWPVLPLDTVGDLAESLGLHPTRLAWFADLRSRERSAGDEALRHYRYRWVPKRSGGARLLEAPKPQLRFFQRRILRDILDHIPPHDAAHGFRRGRSVHTFVEPHVGQAVVIRIDLESFFTSVAAGRAYGILRAAGYPERVAHVLTGLVTNAVPASVLDECPRPPTELVPAQRRARQHLAHPHLPQGSPTSPAISNLAAHNLDRRVSGLAASFGASYTRYADDLALSGDRGLGRGADTIARLVADIARDEGFRVNEAKTRVRTGGQRQLLGGLVVNRRANVRRDELDRLKAIIHDAVRNGPGIANRDDREHFRAHLQGRLSWLEATNPARAARLREQYERIEW